MSVKRTPHSRPKVGTSERPSTGRLGSGALLKIGTIEQVRAFLQEEASRRKTNLNSPLSQEERFRKWIEKRAKTYADVMKRYNERKAARSAAPLDDNKEQGHTQTMSDVTMDQIDQKLSGIEERMDKRIDRMEAAEEKRALSWRREQEAYRKEQEARDRLYAERSEATSRRLEDRDKIIDSKLDAVNASIMSAGVKVGELESKLSTNLQAVKDSNRSTALFIIGTVIASVLAMLAINATIIYGAKSFFDAGKEIAALQSSIEDLKKSIITPKLEPAPAPAPATAK
ncbi:hypothetical protein [Pseudomonas sp.]|uniref:hypothetical protein n=1 Tax=Pseudomonas sp. TaxID=306 RepID=UPI003F31230B